jgi:oligopeptide/dipeptide ABC transporter ATP-binding protein
VPLEPIGGTAPDLRHPPKGCRFAPRCREAQAICWAEDQALVPITDTHAAACILAQKEPVHA